MAYKHIDNLPQFIPFITIRKKDGKYWGTMAVAVHLDTWLPKFKESTQNLSTMITYIVGPQINPKYFPVPRFYTFDALYFLYKQQQEIDKILDATPNLGGVDTLVRNLKSYMVGEIQTSCVNPCELSRGATILMQVVSHPDPTPQPGEFI